MSDLVDKVGFALIGCGSIGKVHAKIIDSLTEARLVAVVDSNVQVGNKFAQQYSCSYYKDYQEMLLNASVDAVAICLPPGVHSEVTIAAACAGKHVICEKPIDINVPRAQAMVDVCKKHGVKLGVIMQHRFDEPMLLLRKAIRDGLMGQLLWGASRTIWYRDREYFSNPQRGTWKYDGGGALITQSVHYIDLLMCVLGDAKCVSAKCRKLLHEQIEAEDIGVANVEFTNGAIGTIEGTTVAYPGLYAELSVFGEKGTVIIRNDHLLFYRFADGVNPDFEAMLNPEKANQLNTSPAVDDASHTRQYIDFVKAVIEDREPAVTGEDALKSLHLIKSIYQASEEKREIFL